MRHLRKLFSLTAAAPLLFALPAQAATDTATLNVSAVVMGNCLVSSGNLTFGNYDPIGNTDLDATGDFSVTCTTNTPATITLGQGQNAAGGSTAEAPVRQMLRSAGTETLAYHLYRDASRTAVWGDSPTTAMSYMGTGTPETISVYGTIPAAQNVPADNYSDQVTITVTF